LKIFDVHWDRAESRGGVRLRRDVRPDRDRLAAAAFTFAASLMVVPLAALTQGEAARFYRWAAAALGFVGVVGVVAMLADHLARA
jgi:hypothetical protein